MFVWQADCTFGHSLEKAILTKATKYQPLADALSQLRYKCRLLMFIFSSLGNADRLVEEIVQMTGMFKKNVITLGYCSVSAIIARGHILGYCSFVSTSH